MYRALAIASCLALTMILFATASAQERPEFRLGFKALADQIPDIVGEPLENEHWGANGDSLQTTSKGLMAWRKADNWTAFTNGSRTWINGPVGVQDRPNSERFEWEAQTVPTGGTIQLSGVFYNEKARGGGILDLKLQPGPDRISGEVNFTQRPGDSLVLCGAGSFSTPRQGNSFTASFTSNDPDSGCRGDRSTVFTLKATLDDSQTHVWGTYSTANVNGSQVVDPLGVFEAWTLTAQPSAKKYVGTFHLAEGSRDGVVSMDVRQGTNTVAGYMNFSNYPGQTPLCGAGEFSGERRGSGFSASFATNDPDQGCAFELKNRFLIEVDTADEGMSLTGTYGISGRERLGTFTLSAN